MPTAGGPLRPAALALAAALALSLAACGERAGTAGTDVAAVVNGETILRSQVREAAEKSARPDEDAALDRLVDTAVLAHAARMQSLEKDPEVRRRILEARRQVLATAYLERLGEVDVAPDPSEVRRFFDGNPLLFSKRRIYTYRELRLQLPAGDLDRLRGGIEAAGSAVEVDRLLGKARVSAVERQVNEPAERVPLSVLAPLALLGPGRSLVQPEAPAPGGAAERVRIVTLVASEPAPLAFAQARTSIIAFMRARQRGEAIASSLAELRAKARIERFPLESRAAAAAGAEPSTIVR